MKGYSDMLLEREIIDRGRRCKKYLYSLRKFVGNGLNFELITE